MKNLIIKLQFLQLFNSSIIKLFFYCFCVFLFMYLKIIRLSLIIIEYDFMKNIISNKMESCCILKKINNIFKSTNIYYCLLLIFS